MRMGLISYILLALELIVVLYPVDSMEDFQFISMIGTFQILLMAFIPGIFLYIGIKSDTHRKLAFIIVFGILIYVAGGFLIGEHVLSPLRELYGDQIHVIAFFIFVITKIIGLTLLSYASTKFYL